MSELTKEWLQQTIAELEEERDAVPGAVNEDAAKALAAMKLALASLEAEAVPEWTNEKCLEFLSIAFRHAEIKGDLELDDIRLGVKMVNGGRAAMLQGAENAESPTTMQTAPSLDSSQIIAESPSGNSPVIPDCSCGTCRPVTFTDSRFVVCSECGNKRCPHANDHHNACTGSNEPGQEGSAYPAAPRQEV